MASLNQMLELVYKEAREEGRTISSEEAFDKANKRLNEIQRDAWTEGNRRNYGLLGKTPEEQRIIDEKSGPTGIQGSENKG